MNKLLPTQNKNVTIENVRELVSPLTDLQERAWVAEAPQSIRT